MISKNKRILITFEYIASGSERSLVIERLQESSYILRGSLASLVDIGTIVPFQNTLDSRPGISRSSVFDPGVMVFLILGVWLPENRHTVHLGLIRKPHTPETYHGNTIPVGYLYPAKITLEPGDSPFQTIPQSFLPFQ